VTIPFPAWRRIPGALGAGRGACMGRCAALRCCCAHRAQVVAFGALWSCTFLLVGCVEEGIFRCFLQFTLTRSVNFWWALGIVGVLCADLFLRSRGQAGIVFFFWMTPLSAITGNGLWGVFAVALAGVVPCFVLHIRRRLTVAFGRRRGSPRRYSALSTPATTAKTWMDLCRAAIGFVFCVASG